MATRPLLDTVYVPDRPATDVPPAAVFMLGEGKSAIAVASEQAYEHVRRDDACSASAHGLACKVKHHATVQRGVGETSYGILLPHHGAIKQWGDARNRVNLHRPQLSGVNNVKDEIEILCQSAD